MKRKDENNEKIGRRSKKKWRSKKKKRSHLNTMTFRCERQRCDNNV
jgi:hypothetical protein